MITRMTQLFLAGILILMVACSMIWADSYTNEFTIQLLPPEQKIVRVESYQHNTVALIWYDMKGFGQCTKAEMFIKEDDYIVTKKMSCKRADEIDETLETDI